MADSTVRLFRAMSAAEHTDFLTHGLRPEPNHRSLEVKFFATTLEHAMQWGRWLEAQDLVILEFIVAESATALVTTLPSWDNIGPAVFVDLGNLPAFNDTIIHARRVFP